MTWNSAVVWNNFIIFFDILADPTDVVFCLMNIKFELVELKKKIIIPKT